MPPAKIDGAVGTSGDVALASTGDTVLRGPVNAGGNVAITARNVRMDGNPYGGYGAASIRARGGVNISAAEAAKLEDVSGQSGVRIHAGTLSVGTVRTDGGSVDLASTGDMRLNGDVDARVDTTLRGKNIKVVNYSPYRNYTIRAGRKVSIAAVDGAELGDVSGRSVDVTAKKLSVNDVDATGDVTLEAGAATIKGSVRAGGHATLNGNTLAMNGGNNEPGTQPWAPPSWGGSYNPYGSYRP
ncbi:MAG: hypothetical protein V4796_25155 [Burkholderia cenocepacia]